MLVAEITKDYISADNPEFDQTGRKFKSEALRQWWGWGIREGTPADTYFHLAESNSGRTEFKLYDDDNELYYEGWLINDDQCIVQQFVLAWAQVDSGCTTVLVQTGDKYIQEIG